jgi:hypothetical protein
MRRRRDACADAGNRSRESAHQLRVEYEHNPAINLVLASSQDERRRRRERKQRAPPLRIIGRATALDQPVGLAATEDAPDRPRDVRLPRWSTRGIAPSAGQRPLERGLDQLVVGAGRTRCEPVDDFLGDHLGERVTAAQVVRELVQEHHRVLEELASPDRRMELPSAPTDEPQPAKSFVQSLEHGHVSLAVRRTEQLGAPPPRPPLSRLPHNHPRQGVGLRQRHAPVRGTLKQPPRRGGRLVDGLFGESGVAPR